MARKKEVCTGFEEVVILIREQGISSYESLKERQDLSDMYAESMDQFVSAVLNTGTYVSKIYAMKEFLETDDICQIVKIKFLQPRVVDRLLSLSNSEDETLRYAYTIISNEIADVWRGLYRKQKKEIYSEGEDEIEKKCTRDEHEQVENRLLIKDILTHLQNLCSAKQFFSLVATEVADLRLKEIENLLQEQGIAFIDAFLYDLNMEYNTIFEFTKLEKEDILTLNLKQISKQKITALNILRDSLSRNRIMW